MEAITISIHFRENWLIFLGIWGEAELIQGKFDEFISPDEGLFERNM